MTPHRAEALYELGILDKQGFRIRLSTRQVPLLVSGASDQRTLVHAGNRQGKPQATLVQKTANALLNKHYSGSVRQSEVLNILNFPIIALGSLLDRGDHRVLL